MKYGLQVHVETQIGKVWVHLRPSSGDPYQWKTRAEAEQAAYMCYGNDPDIVRVVERQDG